MAELREELGRAPRSSRTYTVAEAASAWLDDGLPGRSERTKTIYKDGLAPLLAKIGHRPLRDLTALEVRKGLEGLSGHPVAVEVFPENSDPESFKTAITRVRTDFGVERLVLRD